MIGIRSKISHYPREQDSALVADTGLTAGRMPQILGWGAAASIVLSTFEYTGGSLRGKKTESAFDDEFDRKEYLRKNRRRPLLETVAELGEGRGLSTHPATCYVAETTN
jgi:hypothetical protein